MSMLAGQVDVVIGVDTHRDTNTAALVDAVTGGTLAHVECTTDALGFKRLLGFVNKHGGGRRVWAIEGTGSFGSGLTTFLLERGEWVVEIDRPARTARRNGAKSDELDAVRAAREALSREHLAAPRARGDREAMRVLLSARQGAVIARTRAIGQLKSLIVNAPEALRDQLRRGSTDKQLAARVAGRPRPVVPGHQRQAAGLLGAAPRAVVTLSWLRTAYVTAYSPNGRPNAVAEWHTRWLPAALEQIEPPRLRWRLWGAPGSAGSGCWNL